MLDLFLLVCGRAIYAVMACEFNNGPILQIAEFLSLSILVRLVIFPWVFFSSLLSVKLRVDIRNTDPRIYRNILSQLDNAAFQIFYKFLYVSQQVHSNSITQFESQYRIVQKFPFNLQRKMSHSISKGKCNEANPYQADQQNFLSRNKQNSVDILFKGLKRKISHQSYSKIKNSYKVRPIQSKQPVTPFAGSLVNRPKLKLSTVSNKILDPEQAHDQLLKLKEANHSLFQENTQLLRKIRKQEKIEQIYKKKLQGKQINDLDFFKVLQIKLLLEVQVLQNDLEQKQKQYHEKINYVKKRKNSFKNQLEQSKVSMYELMIASQQDLTKIEKQKNSLLIKKGCSLQNLTQKIARLKSSKGDKNQNLNQIKKEIRQLRQKFKLVEAQSKRDKNGGEMVGITTLMSSLITNSQNCKQNSSAILKNNMSSISVKNRTNIEEIEKQIEKIKEQYNLINSQIQEYMDEKIKQKILVHKQINAIEEKQRKQREIQNRNLISYNVGKIQNVNLLKVEKSTNALGCSIVVE